MKPRLEQHRRLSVCCPGCGTRAVAERPAGAGATPFGPRLHALALDLTTFQALSYERLEGVLKALFGLTVSQGGLTNMLHRAEARSAGGRDEALALGLKLWLGPAFALAGAATPFAASTVASGGARGSGGFDDLPARATTCDLTRAVQDKIRRARDQRLTFTFLSGQVEPTNNACERDLRPARIGHPRHAPPDRLGLDAHPPPPMPVSGQREAPMYRSRRHAPPRPPCRAQTHI